MSYVTHMNQSRHAVNASWRHVTHMNYTSHVTHTWQVNGAPAAAERLKPALARDIISLCKMYSAKEPYVYSQRAP